MQTSDLARQKRHAVSKSRPRKPTAGNRYHRRAKTSEYTTLKILKGFAEERTVQNVASGMHISEKTLRNIYMRLRHKIMRATLLHPLSFGGAGLFLYRGGGLSRSGCAILASVRESRLYRRHMRIHAPRLADPSDEKHHLFEVTARIFCHIAMTKTPETLYPPETLAALHSLQDMGVWIAANRAAITGHERYGEVPERFASLVSQVDELAEADALLSLKDKSREHVYAERVLYNDFRRYLLTDPL